jgi:hypothetical protein
MGTKLALPQHMKTRLALVGLFFLLGCPVAPFREQASIEISAEVSLENTNNQITITGAFFSFAALTLISDVDTNGQKIAAKQIISSKAPTLLSLSNAPPALYSRLKISIEQPNPNTALPSEFQGERLSLLLEGEAQIADGVEVPFRIKQDKQLKDINLVLSQGLDLSPGEVAQISIRGDVSQMFTGVSFEEIQPEDLTDGLFLLDLQDNAFLNAHPAAKTLATKLTTNLEQSFTTNNP